VLAVTNTSLPRSLLLCVLAVYFLSILHILADQDNQPADNKEAQHMNLLFAEIKTQTQSQGYRIASSSESVAYPYDIARMLMIPNMTMPHPAAQRTVVCPPWDRTLVD
jgi:hypothetical protein